MGSDSIQKSIYGAKYGGLHLSKRMKRVIAIALLLSLCLFLIISNDRSSINSISTSSRNLIKKKHDVYTRNHQAAAAPTATKEDEIDKAKLSLPLQCHAALDKIMSCQNNMQESIVFACHRKWCNSFYGHCETVNGIGDRTKHMLSMFTDASLTKCLRVELDYPQTNHGVELRFQDFEYRDPWGYIAELFHFRSYDVSDLKVNMNEWGIHRQHQQQQQQWKSNEKQTFVHFIPSHDQYQFHKYDPCLYHILFKTTTVLETEIQYYSDLIGLKQQLPLSLHQQQEQQQEQQHQKQKQDNNVLGMHFRTGDLTAFGLKNNDERTKADKLIESYNMM
jgi:hypothetical protein